MIVAIHGLGDRPESFIRLMEDFDRAARVIAVRGIIPYREGRAWFAIRFRDNEPEALAAALAKAADRVAATIRDLQERRPTRGRPIVLGFSQGGMMSFALAVRHPDLFAAALPISGWLPPALLPRVDVTAPIPIRTLHGVNDRIVPFAPTASVAKQLERVGQPVELIPFPGVGHRITPPMKARLFSELRELL
jgi:phospholipase/carboxylesterase